MGLTVGYDDGTFKPERPLSKRHAVVFMERFYDEILGAAQAEGFTRADMMVLLKTISDSASGLAQVDVSTSDTTSLADTTQQVSAPGGFTAVAAGGGHSCGLRTDGTVVCWGENRDGQEHMIVGGPSEGINAATAAKIAVVVHAQCDRDGHPLPCWVTEGRSPPTSPECPASTSNRRSAGRCARRPHQRAVTTGSISQSRTATSTTLDTLPTRPASPTPAPPPARACSRNVGLRWLARML